MRASNLNEFAPDLCKFRENEARFVRFPWIVAQNERFLCNFVAERRILLEREPTVFRYSIKLPHTTKSVINEGCLLTPYRGVSIGGIRQYHAGVW